MSIHLVGIAKNEEKGIREWLAYHISLGFDRITVYNNESDDNTAQMVQKSSQFANIDLIDWPSIEGHSPQRSAYNHAIQELRRDSDWVAFFDIDEFLILNKPLALNDILESAPNDAGAIGVNWLTFGSSGQEKADYESVLRTFRYGPPRDFARNRIIKTIARPYAVDEMHIHMAFLRPGYHYYHPDLTKLNVPGKKIDQSIRQDYSAMQLHHYVTKSKEEWAAKILRGRAAKRAGARDRIRSDGEELFKMLDRNDAYYDDADTQLLATEKALKILNS